MSRDEQPREVSSWSAADVRRLEMLSSHLVTSIFAGAYRSVFRGRGIEFEEVREYQPGDDIRSIDWNVTARCGRPFVKRFVEEREMTVMILLDQSASLDCRAPRRAKSSLAAEICALLAFVAVRSNDRVGLITFTDRIESYIPPAKGSRHAQRLVAALLQAPGGQGTDLAAALRYLERVQRRGSLLFVVSDFLAADFRLPLAAVARHYEVIAVSLTDASDDQLPAVGLLRVTDPESGNRHLVDTAAAEVRERYRLLAATRRSQLKQVLADTGVEHLIVDSAVPPLQALGRFFHSRRQRLSR
jgi:uncharacterized protein (DUF58 family)